MQHATEMETTRDVVRARGLVKRYQGGLAVDHVDLSVRAGERVALLGPNGAGKTTTLFMLLGVVTPDEGWVEITGHRLPEGRRRAMEEVGFSAGYMPLAERLRVREFLHLYGQLQGLADPSERIEIGLERFRISHLAGAMSTQLSSGQRTLVGIVKATLHRPRVLVLDEPTASLDPEIAQRVRDGLQELCREEGTTLLITSHNMVEIERLCDRVIFLAHGRVVADDSPSGVADRFGHGDLEGVFLHLAASAPPSTAREDRSG
jgi:ABC-2 type transport system ATP-binding protein